MVLVIASAKGSVLATPTTTKKLQNFNANDEETGNFDYNDNKNLRQDNRDDTCKVNHDYNNVSDAFIDYMAGNVNKDTAMIYMTTKVASMTTNVTSMATQV